MVASLFSFTSSFILGDTGFMGLAIFLCIFASSFSYGRQIKTLARGDPNLKWAISLAGKLQLSLIVLLTSGAALSVAYQDLNYIIFGMFSAMRAIVRDQAKQRQIGGNISGPGQPIAASVLLPIPDRQHGLADGKTALPSRFP